jgi:cobalt-zinc-cadmium efflux system membrane fusion protein
MKYIILLTSMALILNVYAQDNHNHAQNKCEDHKEQEHKENEEYKEHDSHVEAEKNHDEHTEDDSYVEGVDEHKGHDEHKGDDHETEETHNEHGEVKHNSHDSHSSHETEEEHDEQTESDDEHEGHGHVENKKSIEEHDDHDSNAEGVEIHDEQTEGEHDEEKEETGIFVSPEMIKTVGIKMEKAHGGAIARYTTLPAEIKLNRNKHTGISPKYASTVRQIFVEIGDKVKKDDVLVSLENRSTLTVYTLLAPFDGTIISKNVAVGESVEEGTKLFELADLSSVWADVSVYPKYLHKIKKGSSVTVVATDNHTVNGTISYISPLASEETRTFIARVVLNNAGTDFIPGFFVRARVQLDKKDVAIRVNKAAVQTMSGESVVFIKEHDNFITQVVQTGFYDDQYIEIIKGLRVGDIYVAKGAFTLKAETTTSGLDPHAGHGH